MTFEGQYLTYAEYQELGGSAIGLMPFNLLEFEARKRIDLRTHKRLIGVEEIPNEVKLCIYNLINIISKYTSDYDRNLSSETVGSYSVTYANNISEVVKNKETELDDVILNDLYGVIVNNQHIIYNGV